MLTNLFSQVIVLALIMGSTTAAFGQNGKDKKVFMVTDMEGVDGIFNSELQCDPLQSPRFEESRKLLTGEINAAIEGLLEGGATEIVVWDGHDSSRTLSTLDIHPKARLLMGTPVSSTMELNSSYGAIVFIGQHAMAGAEKGVLSHSYSTDSVQNIWVNGMPVGEIGARVMLAGTFGIPAIMLSGDTAACKEIHQLVPQAECAEVKQGVSRTAALSLSHPAARSLIHEKARRAMERLAEFKPYTASSPVEVKVQLTPKGTASRDPAPGVEQIDERTWVFRGKDIIEAWLKYSRF